MKSQTILNLAKDIPNENIEFSKNWQKETYSFSELKNLLQDKTITINNIGFTTRTDENKEEYISIKSIKKMNIKEEIKKMNFNQLLLTGIIIAGISAFITKIIIKFYS